MKCFRNSSAFACHQICVYRIATKWNSYNNTSILFVSLDFKVKGGGKGLLFLPRYAHFITIYISKVDETRWDFSRFIAKQKHYYDFWAEKFDFSLRAWTVMFLSIIVFLFFFCFWVYKILSRLNFFLIIVTMLTGIFHE